MNKDSQNTSFSRKTKYIKQRKPFLKFMGYIFCILLIASFPIGFFTIKQYNDLSYIKKEYEYYNNLIDYAQNNSVLIVDGVVVNKILDEKCGMWYLVYKIQTKDLDWITRDTYSCYTLEQVNEYNINNEIQVVVNETPVPDNVKSIPLSFKGISLEDVGQFQKLSRSSKTLLSILIGISVSLVVVGYTVFYIQYKDVKNKRKRELEIEREKVIVKDENGNNIPTHTCSYCGSVIGVNNKRCPYCGANLKTQKTNVIEEE